MIGIYKITNKVNGKVYIGQSNNVEHRWIDHKSSAYNEGSNVYNYILYKAIRKYGVNNFYFEMLEECEEDKLNDLEIMYIEKYHSYIYCDNPNGYNMTVGGGGIRGHKHSDETKEKMSKANGGENHPLYGVVPSQSTRDKIAKANSNPSDETRRKKSEAKLGRKIPEEQVRKMLETKLAKGIIKQIHPKEKENKKNRKVICLNTGEVFDKMKYGKEKYNANDISKCCSGRQKTSGKHTVTGEGLKWMYYDEYLKMNEMKEVI